MGKHIVDYFVLYFLGLLGAWLLLDIVGLVAPRKIAGIPSIPGYPIVGNLFQLLENASKTYTGWSERYGDVYQVRMGAHRFLVINSFEEVKQFWIKNSCENNSRPVLYTFHKIVSKTQGFTIGSTPQGPRYKVMKKTVSTALNKRNVSILAPAIDDQSRAVIRFIVETMKQKQPVETDLMNCFQNFALKLSIYMAYGIVLDTENRDRELAQEIIKIENKIINLRSQTSNLEDYLIFLRYIPLIRSTEAAAKYRHRRDVYMDKFLFDLKQRILAGNQTDCLVSQILGNPVSGITESELKSICLTLVSAGLDNTPYTLNHCMGHLSQPVTGEKFQALAIKELENTYGNLKKAWEQAPYGVSCDYIVALLNETLRYFTVLPLSLPRATSKAIIYKNSVIPAGTYLIMNAYQANHDPNQFSDPTQFQPSRFLDGDNKLHFRESEGTLHFTFGAGSRGCSGKHLAFQEMYTLLVRVLIAFKVTPPQKSEELMLLDPFEMNQRKGAVSFEPRPFRYGIQIRDPELLQGLVNPESE